MLRNAAIGVGTVVGGVAVNTIYNCSSDYTSGCPPESVYAKHAEPTLSWQLHRRVFNFLFLEQPMSYVEQQLSSFTIRGEEHLNNNIYKRCVAGDTMEVAPFFSATCTAVLVYIRSLTCIFFSPRQR
jgi:hypothetical protein